MNTLKPNSTLQGGKYHIVRKLGQGSFGITYLAMTKTTVDGPLGKINVDVNVAIKEFFMEDMNNRAADGVSVERTSSTLVRNYLQKFRREAENLSRLNHPNIVKVLEVFEENNTVYYVMEYIKGETLDDYIKRQGYLSEQETVRIGIKISSALAYMHDQRILHLDLKPKNVMLSEEEEAYLIDFGLSKQYTADGEPESSTSVGLGTPGYAPLEQANYKQDGTFPATLDIYALGATVLKMLTGKTPPDASAILNDGLPVNTLKEHGVSEAMIALVEKAMAPMRKERYNEVREFMTDMKPLVVHEKVTRTEEATQIESEVIEEHTLIDNDKAARTNTPEHESTKKTSLPLLSILVWSWGLLLSLSFVLLCCNNIRTHNGTIGENTVAGFIFTVMFLGFVAMLMKKWYGFITVSSSIVAIYIFLLVEGAALLFTLSWNVCVLIFSAPLFIKKDGIRVWKILKGS